MSRGGPAPGGSGASRGDRPVPRQTDPFAAASAAADLPDHGLDRTYEESGPEGSVMPKPPLLRLPQSIAEARVRPRGAALLGMLIIVVVAAGLFAGRVWWTQQSAMPQSLASADEVAADRRASPVGSTSGPAGRQSSGAPSVAASTSGSGPPVAGTSGGAAPSPTDPSANASAQVVAHVVGEVARPGVVKLPAQARVEEAIRRTGGLSKRADATSVNMARLLVDGEQIVVLAKGSGRPPGAPPASAGPAGTSGAGASGAARGSAAGGTGPAQVDLNTADVAALETLPGVGPVMAQRILAWRSQHGRFSSVDELGEVSGVGEKTLARLRPLVRV